MQKRLNKDNSKGEGGDLQVKLDKFKKKKTCAKKIGTVLYSESGCVSILTTDYFIYTINKSEQKEFSKINLDAGDIVYLICNEEEHKVLTLMDSKEQDEPPDIE